MAEKRELELDLCEFGEMAWGIDLQDLAQLLGLALVRLEPIGKRLSHDHILMQLG